VQNNSSNRATIPTERSPHIDIAKGIGIIWVVVGHGWLSLEHSKVSSVIYSFHMPLFFFLSGVFMRPQMALTSTLTTKANTLLKPYFVTLVPVGIIYWLLKDMHLGYYLFDTLYANGAELVWRQLWFLPHLFILSLFAHILLICAEKCQLTLRTQLLALLSMLLVGVFFIDTFWHMSLSFKDLHYANAGLPLSIDLTLVTGAYFILGYMLAEHVIRFDGLKSIAIGWGMMGVFIITHYLFNPSMDLYIRRYDHPILSTITALSGIYLVLFAAKWISHNKRLSHVFSVIGRGSLFILIFHSVFQAKVFYIFNAKLSAPFIVADAAGIIAGCLGALALGWFIKRIRILRELYLPKRSAH